MTTKQPPIARFQMGSVKAAVWRHVNEQARTRYTTIITRSYKDRNGKWQDSNVFDHGDLPVVAKLADQACLRIDELQAEDEAARAVESSAAGAA